MTATSSADAHALVDRSHQVEPTPAAPAVAPGPVVAPRATAAPEPAGELRPQKADIAQKQRRKRREEKEDERARQAEYRRLGLRPGEVVCPTCGAGNDPGRNFCRIDATPLQGAAVVDRPRWYRRVFTRGSKRKRAAGEPVQHGSTRKKARMKWRRAISIFGKLRRILALLALVGFGVMAITPSLRSSVTDRADRAYEEVVEWLGFAPTDPLNPIDARASSAIDPVPGEQCAPTGPTDVRPEDALRDGNAFTYWAEAAEGPGLNTVIEFRFQGDIDLNAVGFFSGPGTCGDVDFLANPRPREIELRYLRSAPADGGVATEAGSDVLVLADSAEFQTFEVDGNDFDRLSLTILSVYESDQGDATAIAEVEFFGHLE